MSTSIDNRNNGKKFIKSEEPDSNEERIPSSETVARKAFDNETVAAFFFTAIDFLDGGFLDAVNDTIDEEEELEVDSSFGTSNIKLDIL
jgi:hypothetical protein